MYSSKASSIFYRILVIRGIDFIFSTPLVICFLRYSVFSLWGCFMNQFLLLHANLLSWASVVAAAVYFPYLVPVATMPALKIMTAAFKAVLTLSPLAR